MKEVLYGLVRLMAKIHNYLMRLNDAFEYNFSDKELHFLVIGALGMCMLFVVYPLFKWLAQKKHIMVIAWIYVFTMIIVITFAIEIGQKVTDTGNMEFADIVFGVMGFIGMFAVFAAVRGIYHLLRYAASTYGKRQKEGKQQSDEETAAAASAEALEREESAPGAESLFEEEVSYILSKVKKMQKMRMIQAKKGEMRQNPILIAIDGRCAAGKSTLGSILQRAVTDMLKDTGTGRRGAAEDGMEGEECGTQYRGEGCALFHMDDFFLRPEQRTEERLAQPGGNVDHERFLSEVLLPLAKGEDVMYRRFDCALMSVMPGERIMRAPVGIVEGSYSCHPALREYYDLRIFLDVNYEEQLKRIERRNGPEALEVFREKWIPLEEQYFEECEVEECCQIRLEGR